MLRYTLVVGVLAGALGLAACGGSTHQAATKVASLGGGGATTTVAKASAKDVQAAALQYAQCMRKNGVKMNDPTFGADGRPDFGGGGAGGAGGGFGALRDNPNFRKAADACQKYRDAFRQGSGFGQLTPAQQQQMQKSLLAYAKCMRSKGVDFPDPQFDANGRPQFGNGQRGRLLNNGPNADPATQAAAKACRSQLGNVFPGRGGGGGFGGGRTATTTKGA